MVPALWCVIHDPGCSIPGIPCAEHGPRATAHGPRGVSAELTDCSIDGGLEIGVKGPDPVNGSVCADVFKNGNFWNANVVGVQALVGR
jgi:hypothetical protein